MSMMGFVWCSKCDSNLVKQEGDICGSCKPKHKTTIDFSKIFSTGSPNSCLISQCSSTTFELKHKTSRTMVWECTECSWPLKTSHSLKLLKSSPKQTIRRCRRCDSEVTVGLKKNGQTRTSWVCHCCSYTTNESHEPYYDFNSDRVALSGSSSYSYLTFKKLHWNMIPAARRKEILAGINVSSEYCDNLSDFLSRMRG